MALNIIDDFGLNLDVEDRYNKVLETIQKVIQKNREYDLSVSFVSKDTIQQLNREYRNIDKVTDVISFALMDDDIKIHGLEDEQDLGDIFICVDQAQIQAQDLNQSLEKELEFLFIHGVLHLFGYDHIKQADEDIMFGLQRTIVNELNS